MRTLRTIIAGFALLILASVPSQAVDSLLLPITLERSLDSNGNPVSGRKANVYDAGTLNQKDVFTDTAHTTAAANPIVAECGGRFDARYLGTGSYKIVLTTSADVTIKTADNLPGVTDTTAFAPSSAKPEVPAVSETSARTTTCADLGKCVKAKPNR